jgi:hypothetical protein
MTLVPFVASALRCSPNRFRISGFLFRNGKQFVADSAAGPYARPVTDPGEGMPPQAAS